METTLNRRQTKMNFLFSPFCFTKDKVDSEQSSEE